MRPHSPGAGWVNNASNYHEFSEETMVSNCCAWQMGVTKEENLSEIFLSLSVTQTRLFKNIYITVTWETKLFFF